MKNPKISVLMPVYNGEKYLGEAIESILKQTFYDFEFIILNDCSTDATEIIVKKYAEQDKRIRLVKNEKKIGIASNRNRGVNLANGEYVVWQDADDVSMPERLAKQLKFMESHKNIAACGTWAKAIDKEGNYLYSLKSPYGIFLKYNYWKPSPLINPSSIIRINCIKELLFNENMETAEDYDLWLRISKKYKIFNIKEYLLLYRVHNENNSAEKRSEQLHLSHESFLRNIGIKNINLDEFIAASSIDFKINPLCRLAIIFKIKKIIKYPFMFLILDSLAYSYRWVSKKIYGKK